jgi:2-keto-3-deoxy-L-rhamnonate aldolase RhmA
MATADDDMICMITIEHVEAVNRIDEIMAVPGIDVAVIGPGDLATSIDKRGRIDDPEVQALMAQFETPAERFNACVASTGRAGRPIADIAPNSRF